ncbi:MAG: alpha/beta fold hydrolase [Alphaproteobacteria bacterium]|nr:alpha/beta fold hydrolase [Alphaproteobacteria bacterium]
MTKAPLPFRIAIPDAEITDLKQRLARTRLPNEPLGNEHWEWGTNLHYMARLLSHWADRFDWRRAEAALNRLPQYTVQLSGRNGETHNIHFIHERGSGERPMPLILTHGWPSTFREFADVVEPLAHPERFGGNIEDAFDVVVPSLPGYGFSSKPMTPIGPAAIAELWHKLMVEVLGYPRFAAQAGDWGSFVTSRLALQHPDDLIAIHLTMLPLRPSLKHPSQPPVTAEEADWIAKMKAWWAREEGYRAIQSTKPMALAFALMDSPAGLAAWLADKYWRLGDTKKTHPYAGMEALFPHDLMCTMLSLYWHTGTINSANMLYKAGPMEGSSSLKPGERVLVPTGYAEYPMDTLPLTPRAWAERSYDIRHWRVMPRGGHFAAMEEPALFREDVVAYFRAFR